MNPETSRLRMFAGPNGSGKSTIKSLLTPELLGIYINPDEIEKKIREEQELDLGFYGVSGTTDELVAFFRNSRLLQDRGLLGGTRSIRVANGKLRVDGGWINAYFASVTADFLRQKLLERKASFTFETVMSSSDKIDLLKKAQCLGYRTYLYYIATDDPAINISRVKYRVEYEGGHSVPAEKIISRYARSLDLLREAIRHTNRAYVFDNSFEGEDRLWIAEITDGKSIELKTGFIPAWFQRAVLDKIEESK